VLLSDFVLGIVAMQTVKFRRLRVVLLVICFVLVLSVGYWLLYLTSRSRSQLSQLHSYVDRYRGHEHGHSHDRGHSDDYDHHLDPDYGHSNGRSHHRHSHSHDHGHRDDGGLNEDFGHDYSHSHEHSHGYSFGEKSSFAGGMQEQRSSSKNIPQHHRDDDYGHFDRNKARNSYRQKDVANIDADNNQQNGERGVAGGDDKYDYSDEDEEVDHLRPALKNDAAAADDDDDAGDRRDKTLRLGETDGNELPPVHKADEIDNVDGAPAVESAKMKQDGFNMEQQVTV